MDGGYHWHYLDGVSDDGESAIVVIALLGNPFSPAYARARKRGPASALSYCSMNVALYGKAASAWTFEERRVTVHARDAASVTIGKSSMGWVGDALVVEIDERTSPFGRPVRGKIVLHPEVLPGLELPIDDRGEHTWWPVAPLARIEVDLPQPGVRFSGHGYHDANAGDVPLQAAFESWSWSRGRDGSDALMTYDVLCSSGAQRSLAFGISKQGAIEQLDLPWRAPLPRTRYGLERTARADRGHSPRIVRSLEDGPFYARALVETRIGGRRVITMHEQLAAQRLERRWVRFFTELRMRRV